MKSRSGELVTEDIIKGIKAFVWNAISLSVAITGFLLTLPQENVPSWLYVIWAVSPTVNGLAVVIMRWKQDNTKDLH